MAVRDRLVAWARVQLATRLEARTRLQLLLLGVVLGGGVAGVVALATGLIGPHPARAPVVEVVLPRAAAGTAGAGAAGARSTSGARRGIDAGRRRGGSRSPDRAGHRAGRRAVAVVHAAGAVRRPGLVSVRTPARVADVIGAAGGLLDDADLDALNLAAPVEDGQRVFVPRRGTSAPPVADVDPEPAPNVVSGGRSPSSGGAGAGGGRAADGPVVDVNTATVEELQQLPGVGPATASAIVEHRTRQGPFRSVEQLLDVPGIGPAKLAAMRARVRT